MSTNVFAENQVVTNNVDSGAGTLRQAIIDAGDGDEITFNLSSGNETITLSSELLITENLTIDGYNESGSGVNVTISGNNSCRVINITSGTVILENIGIANGDVLGEGAGINIGSSVTSVTLNKVTVSDNSNTGNGNYGGGIFCGGGNLTINYSTIKNNETEFNGGGIRIEGSAITEINNSTINNNTCGNYGGGIAFSASGNLTINNSTFFGNSQTVASSTFGGGAVSINGTAILTNTTIANNSADNYGGGMFLYDGSISISNSIIANNTAGVSGPDFYYCAGTLTDNGYNVVKYQSPSQYFNHNTSIIYEGGEWLVIVSYEALDNQTLDLASSLSYSGGYTETIAVTGGGFLSDGEGDGSTTETTDQRGYYRKSGTVYYGSTPTSFSNSITRGAYQYYGVVAREGGTWTSGGDYYTHIKGAAERETSGTIVLAGTAIYEPGIALDDNETITIQGAGASSTFVQAAQTAGISTDRVFNITTGTVTLEDMTIRNGYAVDGNANNTSPNWGGGIYIAGSSSVALNNITVTNNKASFRGGGIAHYSSSTLTLTGCTVSYNSTDNNDGGGIICAGVGGTVTLNNTLVDHNFAADGGGGIYTAYGDLVLNNSNITNNTADDWGGGIYHNNNTPLTITGGTINSNSAGYGGGGICTGGYASVNALTNVTIDGNDANGNDANGGGISHWSSETLSLTSCTLSNNECADGIGGGLCQETGGGAITISQSVFDGNKSYDGAGNGGNGGAIACMSDATVNIDHSTFKNNYAYWNGGGVFLENSGMIASISNSTFYNNVAGNWGGGFIIEQGDVTLVNSTFSGNSTTNSAKGGGAIAVWSQSATLKFLTVANNTAAGNGAGIYFDTDYSGTFNISNCLAANNTGNGTGDDLYNNDADLTDNGYNIVEVCNLAANATGGLDNATDILYNTKYNTASTTETSWTKGSSVFAKQNLYLSSTLALNNNPNGTWTLSYTDGNSIGIDDGTGTDPDQRGATVYNGTKDIGAYEWQGSSGTLPVTLSSFTAQYIESMPILCWTTQSESENAGWNIYRGETNEALSNEETYQLNLSLGLIPGAGTTSLPTEYSFEDVFPIYLGTTYFYWLESIDYSGETEIYGPISLLIPAEEWQNPNSPEIPKPYGLHQNYPNPFNPNTEISFMMKESCIGELSIYNVKGQKIKTIFSNLSIPRDELIIYNWNGKDETDKDVSTGVYYYELRTTKGNFVRKMILMK